MRLRILAGAMVIAAAVPAVARAQAAPVPKQHPAADSTRKAVPARPGAPAQKPAATTAQKPVAQKGAQQPAPTAQKPGATAVQKPLAEKAEPPAAATGQKPAGGAGVKAAAQRQQPTGAAAQKPGQKAQKPVPPRVGERRGGKPRRAVESEAERAAMAAKPPSPAEPVKDTVVVKPGDTLWDLSTKYLGSPYIWPRVYNANRSRVDHPHWIYPGQKLAIPGPAEIAAALAEKPEPDTSAAEQPQVQELAAPEAQKVDTVVEEDAGPLRRPIVDRSEYLAAPWVAHGVESIGSMLDRVKVEGQAERLAQAVIIHDRIYLRPGARMAVPAVGTELLLVRVNRRIGSFGDVVEPTGVVRVERGNKDVAVAEVVQQFGPILQGDHVLPMPTFTPPQAIPAQAVTGGPQGELFAFLREQPLHTVADVAFISIGKADGLQVGDELIAYAPTRPAAADPGISVPPEDVARLVVLKVMEHTATVRPLSMRLPSLQTGLRVRLVARVP